MTNLKEELAQYLNSKNKNESSVSISMPELVNLISYDDVYETRTNRSSIFTFPSLSRVQRIVAFVICIGTSLFFLFLSTMFIPVLLLKARKFAILYSMGTLFFILSIFFLWGPATVIKYFFSKERVVYPAAYSASFVATIYFAIWEQSTPLTALFAVFQVIIEAWYIFSCIPGGKTGFSIMRGVFSPAVSTFIR